MDITKYLREQAMYHPSMRPQDVVKMCYQAAFGAEHLLKEFRTAEEYLRREFDLIEETGDDAGKNEPLYECISDSVCRVNLRVWKRKALPLEWLYRMFVEASNRSTLDGIIMEEERRETFGHLLEKAEDLVEEGVFGFGVEEWKNFLINYSVEEPISMHHSEEYRAAERPSYRLVNRRFERVFAVMEEMVKHKGDGVQIVAIDGRCGSGKTSIALNLVNIVGGGVVHMDDFFLPEELRTEQRLQEPGGNIHYERVLEEVLPKLSITDEFTYKRFVCGQNRIGGERKVEAGTLRVVEGSYSCHPKLGDYMTLRVFCDVDSEEQLERIAERDGWDVVPEYREKWIPMEEAYFTEYNIKEKADVVV